MQNGALYFMVEFLHAEEDPNYRTISSNFSFDISITETSIGNAIRS